MQLLHSHEDFRLAHKPVAQSVQARSRLNGTPACATLSSHPRVWRCLPNRRDAPPRPHLLCCMLTEREIDKLYLLARSSTGFLDHEHITWRSHGDSGWGASACLRWRWMNTSPPAQQSCDWSLCDSCATTRWLRYRCNRRTCGCIAA